MIDLVQLKSYLESVLKNLPQDLISRENYIPSWADLPLKVQASKSSSSNQEQQQKKIKYLVLEGLRKHIFEQVLLVGKPGLGKTTALLQLSREEAEKCLEAINQNKDEIPQIPILIELRNLNTSVLAKIKEKLEWWIDLDDKDLKKLIRDRKLLVLLDGLNELPNSSAFQEVEEFRQLCNNFKTSLIISTRELGSTLIQGEMKKLEMLPLTEPQIRDFVKKRLPEMGDKLLAQLKGRLKELGQTPLLLQMLCEVFSEQGDIPKNRGELFRKEFARRYEKFKPERLRNISDDSRRCAFDLLCYLAFRMVQGDSHIDPCQPTASWITISKTQAEVILTELLSTESSHTTKAKEWLEDLLEWHLLQVASEPDCIEFHHQLFQEYYAGEYLAPRLDNLSDKKLQQNYLNYLKWTESIMIAMSFVELEILAERITKLALDVDLKLGAEIAGSVDSNFQEKTVSLISQQQIPDRFKIYLLGETKSSAVIDELIKMMDCQDAETRGVVVWASRKLNLNVALPVFNKAIKDSEPQVRDTAIKAIGELDIDEAVSFAIKSLPQEMEASVRETAVIWVLNKSQSESAILQLLKSTQDVDHNVSTMAAYGLEQKNRQRILSFLTKFLKDKKVELLVRKSAAEQLGNLGDKSIINDLFEASLDLNIDIAVKAKNAYNKIKKIIQNNQNTQSTFQQEQHSYVQNRYLNAIYSENPILRGNAVNYLTSSLCKSEAVDLARKYLNDSDHYVRGHAIMSLTTLIGKHALPEIMKALEDPYPHVYHEASKALIQIKASLPVKLDISQDIINKLIENLNQDKDLSTRSDTAKTLIHLFSLKPSLKLNENLRNSLYNASFNSEDYFRSQVARCLGEFSSEKVVKRLLTLIEDNYFGVSLCASEAIKNIPIEIISKFIPNLAALTFKSEKCLGLDPMLSIQSSCGFYNYDICQKIKHQKEPETNNSLETFYKDLDQIIYQIQENPELRQGEKEDRLTIEILGQMKILGYQAEHEAKVGGHADIIVRKDTWLWLGEAKIFKGNSYLWEGFRQLTTRYSTGDINQDNGGLLIYIFKEDAKSIMQKWQNYLTDKNLTEYSCKSCKDKDLSFISSHKHDSSGRKFHVKHIPVILHHSPQDRSGRKKNSSS